MLKPELVLVPIHIAKHHDVIFGFELLVSVGRVQGITEVANSAAPSVVATLFVLLGAATALAVCILILGGHR